MKTLAALLAFGACVFPIFGQAPAIAGGPINSASFSALAVAPGSLVSIFGSQLATSTVAASSVPLPLSLGGVSVKVNDTIVPLSFVSPGQINFQVPWDVLPGSSNSGTATLTVTRNGVPSLPRQFPVRAVAPGIFRASGDQAVAINADGSIVARVGSLPGAFTHPARPGDTITIYATGLGAVRPAPVLGANSSDALRTALSQPLLAVESVRAEVPFSGLSPEFPGVNQINLTIPATVADGDWLKLQIKSADGAVSDSVTIAVERLPSGTMMPEEVAAHPSMQSTLITIRLPR